MEDLNEMAHVEWTDIYTGSVYYVLGIIPGKKYKK